MEREKFELLVHMFWIEQDLVGEPVFRFDGANCSTLYHVDQVGKEVGHVEYYTNNGETVVFGRLYEEWYKFLDKMGEDDE